jgi:hypothetical protein
VLALGLLALPLPLGRVLLLEAALPVEFGAAALFLGRPVRERLSQVAAQPAERGVACQGPEGRDAGAPVELPQPGELSGQVRRLLEGGVGGVEEFSPAGERGRVERDLPLPL